MSRSPSLDGSTTMNSFRKPFNPCRTCGRSDRKCDLVTANRPLRAWRPLVASMRSPTRPDVGVPPAWNCRGLRRAVDLAAMIDGEDGDDAGTVVDRVDGPVVAPIGAVRSLELEAHGVPDAGRTLGQRAVHERHDGGGNVLWQPNEIPTCGRRPRDVERRVGAHERVIRSLASSRVRRLALPPSTSRRARRTDRISAGSLKIRNVSSSDSRSSMLSITAAGRPCFVITTRPWSRCNCSTTSESRFLASASAT
jgi:hypothetical protein